MNDLGIPVVQPVPLIHFLHEERFDFRAVTAEEVQKIILKSASSKSPGPDKISIQCVKESLDSTLQPLTDIINCSLRTSKYPSVWKLAEVIPILKEGDQEVPSNNRPLSLLAVLSKICDKVVLNQFMSYLTNHNLLSNQQSGNRKKHSTETLNISVTDRLLEAMDNKQVTIMVFLDMSKAFDSVKHDILLRRILHLGASPAVYKWFKSYLTDRFQYVRIGITNSSQLPLTHGIPQGSVLSPFLFNIYTDSLPSVPKCCSLESFVDDSKTFLSFTLSSMNMSLSVLEHDLQNIFEWCCNNSLLINPDKTKMLVVGSRQLLQQLETCPSINFIGERLEPVQEVKDLGLIIDANLTYDAYIKHLSSSCMAKLGQISRVKYMFDQTTLTTIVNTLVMSKINYCSSVWSSSSEENIKKIQLVQNCAARLVNGIRKYDHITPVLNELGWLPIKEHLRYRDTVLVQKCMNNQAPSYLCQKFMKRNQIHDRVTRKNSDLDIPKCRTAAGQRTFKFRGTKLWNELDENLKSITDLNNFKTSLKSDLMR